MTVGLAVDRALTGCPAEPLGDGWQLWKRPDHPDRPDHAGHPDHPEPDTPEPLTLDTLVHDLATETGAPALVAYVMEGDCALVTGAAPGGTAWTVCLGRPALAHYLAGTGLGLDELFPTPEAAAAHCAAWAEAAGRAADPVELKGVLAAGTAPLTGGAEGLFRELLARLGIGRGRPGPPPPTGEAPTAVRCEPW
ncbi:hypothetical protein [Streptomyces sp. UNOB3_S3]|uniref:hypothetical protein n=1 Tax=Streptomyces sp. UNOB3_S3 TaxID=2871682 RepID=UPI001E6082C3|nr:hypothetical protein [Streptomyces sp. UNOB3_S3]MCC3779414.1 hypothetical protein [Streptomyces sp. UNOB3_S3]